MSGEFAPLPHRARVHARRGDVSAARLLLEEAVQLANQQHVPAALIASVQADLGDFDSAFGWLERAFAELDSHLPLLGVWPRFRALLSDPRFPAVLQRV